MTQHATLSAERWAAFSLDQQVLMIANELNRAAKLLAPGDGERLRNAYARVLQLTDLTIGVQAKPGLRRELLRWRDLIAALYAAPPSDGAGHAAALRCLLRFTPVAARQIPLLAATRRDEGGAGLRDAPCHNAAGAAEGERCPDRRAT